MSKWGKNASFSKQASFWKIGKSCCKDKVNPIPHSEALKQLSNIHETIRILKRSSLKHSILLNPSLTAKKFCNCNKFLTSATVLNIHCSPNT